MGTQTEIAKKIIEKGADYILPAKENQEKLYNNVKNTFDSQELERLDSFETSEKSHSRIEIRRIFVSKDVENIDPEGKWEGLSGAAMYITMRESLTTEKIEIATQYLIFSNPNATAEQIMNAKRDHWEIENCLHWRLDVAYDEDNCRACIYG